MQPLLAQSKVFKKMVVAVLSFVLVVVKRSDSWFELEVVLQEIPWDRDERFLHRSFPPSVDGRRPRGHRVGFRHVTLLLLPLLLHFLS